MVVMLSGREGNCRRGNLLLGLSLPSSAEWLLRDLALQLDVPVWDFLHR